MLNNTSILDTASVLNWGNKAYIQYYVPTTTTNVTTYPLLSCGTNITRYVWGIDLSGTPQGAGGVGGLCAVFSPLLKGGGGGADGGLPDGITPHLNPMIIGIGTVAGGILGSILGEGVVERYCLDLQGRGKK